MPIVQLPTQKFEQGPSKYSATEVQAMIHHMDACMKKHASLKETDYEAFAKIVEQECEVLVNFLPAVFSYNLVGGLDETFSNMLKEKRKIEKGLTTEDKASVRLGKKLFQTWVAPTVRGEKTLTYAEFLAKSAKNES